MKVYIRLIIDFLSQKVVIWPLKLSILFLGIAVLLVSVGFRWNVTPSLPYGIYLLESDYSINHLDKNDIVAFKLDTLTSLAHSRGYLLKNNQVAKYIMAMPGDTITVKEDCVIVNNDTLHNSAKYNFDSKGRRLPQFWADHKILSSTEYFFFSPVIKSFDSRYFGLINESQFLGTLDPIITF